LPLDLRPVQGVVADAGRSPTRGRRPCPIGATFFPIHFPKSHGESVLNEALSARAADLNQRIAALRRQRAAALLAGDAFDRGGIADAEAELAALGDAEGEAVAQRRTKARETADRRRGEVLKAVTASEASRLAAVGRAEAAARALSSALDEVSRK